MAFDFSQVKYIIFDFDGVFTDNRVSTHSDGTESVITSKYDSLAISILLELESVYGFKTFVVSGEASSVVVKRCEKMGIKHYVNVADKLKFVVDNFGEDCLAETVFACNDLNDLQLMSKVGFSVVPSDAPPIIKDRASRVSGRKGGENFVRDVVEIVLGKRIESSRFFAGGINEF
jgi:YrbI family 3-deoxy-D-manno-octulosonate 8-phosphate phosphatase